MVLNWRPVPSVEVTGKENGELPPKLLSAQDCSDQPAGYQRARDQDTAQASSSRLFYCPQPQPSQAPLKLQNYPHLTAHPLSGGVQSGEKTGHSPSDSSGDTLGASSAGSRWGRGGCA